MAAGDQLEQTPRQEQLDPEDDPKRALAVALLAMAGVAVVVGLALGLGAATFLKTSGLDEGRQRQADSAPASLFIPQYQPTEQVPEDLGLPEVTPTEDPSPSPTEKSTPKRRITLFVAPQTVSPGERINFNGVYQAGEGATLQIQRKENGAWVDFPVDTVVNGGVFSTWITTSRPGVQPFRVYDIEREKPSNVVRVTIG